MSFPLKVGKLASNISFYFLSFLWNVIIKAWLTHFPNAQTISTGKRFTDFRFTTQNYFQKIFIGTFFIFEETTLRNTYILKPFQIGIFTVRSNIKRWKKEVFTQKLVTVLNYLNNLKLSYLDYFVWFESSLLLNFVIKQTY